MTSTPPTRRAFWVGIACAVAVLAIWTSFILIARFSAQRHLTPFDLAFLRFVFSGLAVLPFAVWRGRWLLDQISPDRAQALLRAGALTAIAGVGYCSLAYSGFFFAPVAHAAVLLPGSLPLYTALGAVVLLGEHLSRGRLVGLAMIVAGNLLVGGVSLLQAFEGEQTWKGDLLFMGASVTWALYSVLCRRWHLGAVPATAVIAIGSLASYVPLYLLGMWAGVIPSQLPEAPWSEIAFQAVYQGGFAMLIAGVAFTQVIKTFGPVRTTMITAVVPVLAALAAVPLLGEGLGVAALIGLACVTLGLLVGLRAQAGALPPLLAKAH